MSPAMAPPLDTTDTTDGGTLQSTATSGDTGVMCAWEEFEPEPFTEPVGYMAACVGGLTKFETQQGATSPVTVEVGAAGTGDRPADCVQHIWNGTPPKAASWVWFRGTDGDGQERVFGWSFASPSLGPAVESTVTVHQNTVEKRYVGTQEQELGVLDASGDVLVWAQQGASDDLFRRSPQSLEPAKTVATGQDECTQWSHADATVDGVGIAHGETAAVGALQVVHGGIRVLDAQLDPHQCKKCQWWLYPVSAMGAFQPAL